MHPDQPHLPVEPYWQHDRVIGMATFFGQPTPIRMKAHLFTERFFEPAEMNWFGLSEGERTYIFMRPYLTLPATVLPARPRQSADPELDALFGSTQDQSKRKIERAIGTASAAYYPAVHGLLVWQFHLSDPFRPEDPALHGAYQTLWQGMEALLLDLLPETHFLVTPSWDPDYDQDTWDRFLVSMDYLPHLMDAQLFMKSRQDVSIDPPRQRP